ncbi:MAG TPA: hypothetical protein PK668_17100 [Myxococcota bacterium]|nr:hypothetical protein [Myxococcota bacterium]HRY94878.1 hypothetical protein [Myxococcota bacterium]
MTLRQRMWMRLLPAGLALALALGCGDTGCSCGAPLAQPMPEEQKVYDAVQLRLAPTAFQFIQGNLTEIISQFMEGGLAFEVPYVDATQEFDAGLFTVTIVLHICETPCPLNIEIVSVNLNRIAPNVLALDARVNVSGTITITGDIPDCEVPIDIQNKPISANLVLGIDGRDHVLTFDVQDLLVEIAGDDYDLDCDWGWFDFLMDPITSWLTDVITPLLNGTLQSQLDTAVADALDGARCLNCDFYSLGCPAGSACDGDGEYCEDGQGCRAKPLGMVGSMDLGELLASVSPGMQASLDLFLAVGQWEDSTIDPLVKNDGLELRMIGGAATEHDRCVPTPPAEEIPSAAPPPRLGFTDVVPGTAVPYMAGIGVSDRFVDWFLYQGYLGGLLCLSLGSDTTDMLSSGTFSLLMGSLATLTGGANTPVMLRMRPEHVPSAEIGAGTFSTDAEGNRVIDEPLLYLNLPGLALDFYVMIDERFVRVVTLTQDISLQLALDFTADNELVPLFGADSIQISNVRASNYELLAEDPASLEQLVPTLIDMALPLLTGSLEPIALPPIQGFALSIAAVQGDYDRQGTPYHEYLGLYANLSLAPVQPSPRRTTARLAALEIPDPALMSIRAAGGPRAPVATLEVGADGDRPAEYSWRLDGGGWSLFQPGPRLRVQSPRLLLAGRHSLEVRARSVGDYTSLDPEPARVDLEVATPAPALEAARLPRTPAAAVALAHELALAAGTQAAPLAAGPGQALEPQAGCASAGGSASLAGLLLGLLAGLALLRRRA